MKKLFLLFFVFIYSLISYSQIEYADILIDYYYSGANSDFYDIYGAKIGDSNVDYINPEVVLGNNDYAVSLPTGSWVIVGFADNTIIDGPNQNDIYIREHGAAGDRADVYVSSNGVNFYFLGRAYDDQVTALDLADIGFTEPVVAVKIVGLDNNGNWPGFDLVSVNAQLPGALGPSVLMANFDSKQLNYGAAPFNVEFKDLSLGEPYKWEWYFPGGTPSSSTQQNPSVSYNNTGVYNVTLKVTNSSTSHSITKESFITVRESGIEYPDLSTYQPEEWTDKIIINKTQNSLEDDSDLETDDNLYCAFSVWNSSDIQIDDFVVKVYLDGNEITSKTKSLEPWYYTWWYNIGLGKLAAGSHEIKVIVDPENKFIEENEYDNVFTKKFIVKGIPLPNLKPYRIQNDSWGDALTISNKKDDKFDSEHFTDQDDLYIAFGYQNENQNTTKLTKDFKATLYIDNEVVRTIDGKTSFFDENGYNATWNIWHEPLSGGNHTIKLFVDSENNIEETDESDNIYEKIIYVEGTIKELPNLIPYKPEDWSDKIVIDNKTGSFIGSTNFTTEDELYIDYASLNEGAVDINQQFNTYIYVDDVYVYDSYSEDLPANYYTYYEDYYLGSLSAGSHKIKIVVDANNTIEESIENDNEYSVTITVTNPTTIINEIENGNQISIFPLPAKDILTINGLKNISDLEIYSMTGKLIKQQIVNNGNINISDLKQGVYFVKIQDNGKVLTTQRIVKQ